MKRIWRMAAVAAALAAAGGAHAETPADRAWRNYELLRSGAKKPGDLSDIERRELATLLQLGEDRKADRRTPRQRCIDEEVEREGRNPSDLARRAIDLKCSQR